MKSLVAHQLQHLPIIKKILNKKIKIKTRRLSSLSKIEGNLPLFPFFLLLIFWERRGGGRGWLFSGFSLSKKKQELTAAEQVGATLINKVFSYTNPRHVFEIIHCSFSPWPTALNSPCLCPWSTSLLPLINFSNSSYTSSFHYYHHKLQYSGNKIPYSLFIFNQYQKNSGFPL